MLCFAELCPQDKSQERGQKEGTRLYLERLQKGALGQDGRPGPQTTGARGTQTLFSGVLHGEEQPGHRTADTTYRLDPVSPSGCLLFPKSHVLVSKFNFSSRGHGST